MKFCSYFYVAVTIFIHDRIAFVCLVCADLYALFMLLVSLYKENNYYLTKQQLEMKCKSDD